MKENYYEDENIDQKNIQQPQMNTSVGIGFNQNHYQNNSVSHNNDDENWNNFRHSTERPVFKLSVKLIDTYKYINKVGYRDHSVSLSYSRGCD